MCETSISVWLVCKLCRDSFGQVNAFIEHKKQKHFTQFQNISCIVFEEAEHSLPCPVITNGDHQFADESNEPRIKIEVNDEDPNISFSSEIIDEPNLDLFAVKSELITYESEINSDNQNSFFGLEQPEQNPYVLLKRLTSEEIQRACFPQRTLGYLTLKQKDFLNNSEAPSVSADVDSNNDSVFIKVEKPTENEPFSSATNVSTEGDLQFECKLCSKQLETEAQLKIHVGICALPHKDRNRFCVTCNRKFSCTKNLHRHCLRFHGTEEEKLSLFKFKCHVCSKPYQKASDLRFHLESHEEKKQQVKTSKSKSLRCSQPNCGKEFGFNSELQRHIAIFHLGERPFTCHFPNCNKAFSLRGNLNIHLRLHTGERPYKCSVDNCNEAFISFHQRFLHHQKHHCDL